MRIPASLLLSLAFLGSTHTSVEGQLTLEAGISYAEALGGQWGGDVRLGYGLMASPAAVFIGADYYLADCEQRCGLWGWRIGGTLDIPIPWVTPYALGAWVHREKEFGAASREKEGLALGVGVGLDLGRLIRGEVHREFLGGDLDQLVFKVGVAF